MTDTDSDRDPEPDGGYVIDTATDPETGAGHEYDGDDGHGHSHSNDHDHGHDRNCTRGSGDWYRQLLVVAETEYRLAVRGRWAIALTAIFAAFALGLTTFSGASVGPEGFERTVGSLAVLAVYLVPLVALAVSYDVIVGQEDRGWLQTLFSLPVDRAWIVVGAALGRSVVLSSATILGFGIAGAFLLREFGLGGFDAYVTFLLGTIGLGLAFLAIGVLVSTLAREKTHALGISLLAWAWFVLVHDLLGLGLIAAFDLSDAAVAAMLLANPTGVFRALVLGSLGAGGEAGFAAVLAEAGVSTPVLVGALLAWIVVPIGLAAVAIQRRRL